MAEQNDTLEYYKALAKKGVKPEQLPAEHRPYYEALAKKGVFTIEGAQQQEAPTEDPPKADDNHLFNLTADHFRSGVSSTLALPALALDAFTIVPRDSPAPETLFSKAKRGWDYLLSPSTYTAPVKGEEIPEPRLTKPANKGEEYLAKTSEYLGGAAIPGLYGVGMAPGLLRKTVAATQAGGSAVLGGLGAEGSGDLAEATLGKEYRPTAEMVGGLLGGLLPYNIEASYRGAKHILKAAEEKLRSYATDNLTQSLGSQTDEVVANLKQADELGKRIPGFKPDVAAASGSETAVAVRNSITSVNKKAHAEQAIAHKEAVKALQDDVDRLWPEVASNSSVLKAARTRLKATIGHVDTKIANLSRAYEAEANKIYRGDSSAQGDKLVALRNKMEEEAAKTKNEMYTGVYDEADKLGVKFDASSIRDKVKTIVADAASDITPKSRTTFDKFLGKEPKSALVLPSGVAPADDINFNTWHDLYVAVNRELSKTSVPAKQAVLMDIKNTLTGALRTAPASVQKSFEEANAWYASHYNDVFNKGFGKAIVKSNTLGRSSTAEQNIVHSLVLGKGKQGIDDFKRVYTNPTTGVMDPQAMPILRDGLIDDLARKGDMTPAKISNWMARNKEILDEVPAIRDELSNVNRTMAAIDNRRMLLVERQKALEHGNVSKWVGGNADDVVERAVRSENAQGLYTLYSTVRRAGGEQGVKDLSAMVGRNVISKGYKFFIDNEKKLTPILNKLQPNMAGMIKDRLMATDILTRMVPPKQVTANLLKTSPIEDATGSSLASLTSIRKSLAEGRVSPSWAITHIFTRAMGKRGQVFMQKLLQDTLANRDLGEAVDLIQDRLKAQLAAENTPMAKKLLQIGKEGVHIGAGALVEYAKTPFNKPDKLYAHAIRMVLPYLDKYYEQVDKEVPEERNVYE